MCPKSQNHDGLANFKENLYSATLSIGPLSNCPENLQDGLKKSLKNLAFAWAESPIRPKLKEDVVGHWNVLVKDRLFK